MLKTTDDGHEGIKPPEPSGREITTTLDPPLWQSPSMVPTFSTNNNNQESSVSHAPASSPPVAAIYASQHQIISTPQQSDDNKEDAGIEDAGWNENDVGADICDQEFLEHDIVSNIQDEWLQEHNAESDDQDEEFLEHDYDSAFDEAPEHDDDTETLSSYITKYRWENGRRYHAYRPGAYWGPNDESANDQQDLAHHLYKLTLDDELHLAPIGNPHAILDIGTGTGIWAIEMADRYPSARVIGTDLSPTQPIFVPPNCSFEIEDCTAEWTYPADSFDFIHIREMFGSIPDWDSFFQQTMLTTKPGGWVEILEHSVTPVSDDDTVGPDSFYTLWGKTVLEMGERFGKSFEIWSESRERMERAGFENVVEKRYKWPMNAWAKDPKLRELGLWNQLRLYDGVEGFMIRLLTVTGGWSYDRAQLFLAEMRSNLKDRRIHGYLEVSVVYGRKPFP